MADTGVKYPLTFDTITVALASAVVWATPSRILLDDAAYAGVTGASFDAGNRSQRLRTRNYNISVPATATITGIVVEAERYYSVTVAADYSVVLTKNGTVAVGNNYASVAPVNFISSPAVKTYGSSSDLWGTTWVVSNVTASTFGVLYEMQPMGANVDGFLDYIRTTIHYDLPGTLQALAGISNGTATVTSEPLKRTRYISSQSTGTGTANASILRSMNIQGSISGVATSSGSLNRFLNMASSIAGAASVDSAVKLARNLVSSVAGAATTNVALTVSAAVVALSAIANGIATVAASISRSLNFQSSIAGVATVTTSLNRLRTMASSVAGVATVTSALLRQRGFQVLVNGVATTAASLQRSIAFKVLVSGAATVQGILGEVIASANQILLKIWFALR